MGETTAIEWTDATFNPWIGCTHVHAGCTHCYAESFAKRYGKATWGPNGTRARTSAAYWRKPLKWNREAERDGMRRRVFCASLADVFEDWQHPIYNAAGEVAYFDNGKWTYDRRGDSMRRFATMDDCRRDLFALIDQTPWLDWLLLTKRPQNVRRMWSARVTQYVPEAGAMSYQETLHRDNVWLGTSISDQPTAEAMIPDLLKCRDLCPVLFVSAEPLLGPVKITPYIGGMTYQCKCGFHDTEAELIFRGGRDYQCPTCFQMCKPGGAVSWIIVGGESGHGARPCDVSWVRSIRDQCQAAGVACFVKQLGAAIQMPNDSFSEWPLEGDGLRYDSMPRWQGEPVIVGTEDRKGGDWSEWPDDLRVRQFPVPQPHGGSHQ